jgi:hypothetical protein
MSVVPKDALLVGEKETVTGFLMVVHSVKYLDNAMVCEKEILMVD